MSDRYLWNRAGEPDPEIAELEQLLQPFRYRATGGGLRSTAETKPLHAYSRYWWAAVAAAAMLVVADGLSLRHSVPQTSRDSAWKLSSNGATPHTVRIGQTIETGRSGARLESEFIGEVRVAPNSRLQIIEARKDEQRLALEHGTIHAFIWAPPRQFVVDTPSASTIDLGCEYTLHVGRDGVGSLTVEMGWVAFQWRNLESFMPAGASCTTRPGRGPGTPHFSGTPTGFESALNHFDEYGDSKALDFVLARSRSQDSLTLWHLLSRTHGTQRVEVFTRFSELVKLPPSVTRESILRGEPEALDSAWNALGLGNTDWWREWRQLW